MRVNNSKKSCNLKLNEKKLSVIIIVIFFLFCQIGIFDKIRKRLLCLFSLSPGISNITTTTTSITKNTKATYLINFLENY